MYDMFLDGSDNIAKTFELFRGYAAEAQINYNQNLKPAKIPPNDELVLHIQ